MASPASEDRTAAFAALRSCDNDRRRLHKLVGSTEENVTPVEPAPITAGRMSMLRQKPLRL